MTGINRLIDFPSEDMTVTVEAGMTMLALQRLLHEKGMWLPLDVPHPDKATVGGSLAANITGPRCAGFGSWRDYVLGIHWINDQGDEVKAGGRVVKNVAGYDFCKLMIGSLGTLGIITQVTMKVKPLPEATSVITGSIPHSEMESWSQRLRQSGLRPTACVFVRNASNHWTATIGVEESKAAVTWQVAELSQKLLPVATVVEGNAAREQLDHLATALELSAELIFQAQLPKGQGAAFAVLAASETSTIHIHACTGIVTGVLIASSLEEATQHVNTLRQYALEKGGFLLLPFCPPAWRSILHPFGQPRPDWNLMRHVKRTLDPHNLFQPDRYEVLLGQ